MTVWVRLLTFVALAALFTGELPAGDNLPVQVPTSGALHQRLSEYHFFTDARGSVPNARVIPYDLCTPHFADYATLDRYLWLPSGESIIYGVGGELRYPPEAALILTASYPHDLREPELGRRLVETRVFVYRDTEWISGQYMWNDEETDADLTLAGGVRTVEWTHHDGEKMFLKVHIPNRIQCAMCHENDGKFRPLGPIKAGNINRDFAYADGSENQLARWSRLGYLTYAPENPDDAPRLAVWNDPESGSLDARARAYLEVN